MSQVECFLDALLIVFSFNLGHSSREITHSYFANRPRCSWPNIDDPPRCWQKCYAGLHQVQNILRQKSQRFKTQKKQNMFMFYGRKQIMKGIKLLLQNSVGLGRILLKKCYQTTSPWYAKLAPKTRERFIVCDCVSLHPYNPYPMCKSRLREEIRSGRDY